MDSIFNSYGWPMYTNTSMFDRSYVLYQHPKSRLKPHHRTRNSTHWAAGGPGMQAIFLDPSGQKSCGTGVFLPRRAGTDVKPSKKPGTIL